MWTRGGWLQLAKRDENPRVVENGRARASPAGTTVATMTMVGLPFRRDSHAAAAGIPKGMFVMDVEPIEAVLRNINTRLESVEQILPTLATKAELAAAIAPLATKVELLEVKTELRAEIREEGVRTRQHFDAVAERLEGQIRLVAEGVVALQERQQADRVELKADISSLDRRVTRLEARRRS